MCIPEGVRYIISKIAFDCFKLCTKTVISRKGFSKDISKDKKKKKRHCHYINGTPDANLCNLAGIETLSSAPSPVSLYLCIRKARWFFFFLPVYAGDSLLCVGKLQNRMNLLISLNIFKNYLFTYLFFSLSSPSCSCLQKEGNCVYFLVSSVCARIVCARSSHLIFSGSR